MVYLAPTFIHYIYDLRFGEQTTDLAEGEAEIVAGYMLSMEALDLCFSSYLNMQICYWFQLWVPHYF